MIHQPSLSGRIKKYLSLTTALRAVVEVVSLFGGVDSGTSVVCWLGNEKWTVFPPVSELPAGMTYIPGARLTRCKAPTKGRLTLIHLCEYWIRIRLTSSWRCMAVDDSLISLLRYVEPYFFPLVVFSFSRPVVRNGNGFILAYWAPASGEESAIRINLFRP